MGVCWFCLYSFSEPQPSYLVQRKASFGYAIIEIKNMSYAYYTWHRNQDSERVTTRQWNQLYVLKTICLVGSAIVISQKRYVLLDQFVGYVH